MLYDPQSEKQPTSPALELLITARDYLSKKQNWGQRQFLQLDGQTCSHGAILVANYGIDKFLFRRGNRDHFLIIESVICSGMNEQAVKEAMWLLADSIEGFDSLLEASGKVWAFNDSATHEEVLATFDRAIQKEATRLRNEAMVDVY